MGDAHIMEMLQFFPRTFDRYAKLDMVSPFNFGLVLQSLHTSNPCFGFVVASLGSVGTLHL